MVRSMCLITDNLYLIFVYTEGNLSAVFYKMSPLLMGYICQNINPLNDNPVPDVTPQKLFTSYGALELNGIVHIVFFANCDCNVLRAENQAAAI
jgi:hypothetical protein